MSLIVSVRLVLRAHYFLILMLSRSVPLAQTSWRTRRESISSRTSTARYYETAQWRAKVLRKLLVPWLCKNSSRVYGLEARYVSRRCGRYVEQAVSHSMQQHPALHVTSTIRLAKHRLQGFQLSITDGSVRNSATCLGLFASTRSSYGIDVPWHTQARQTTVYFH